MELVIEYNGDKVRHVIKCEMSKWNNQTYLELLAFIRDRFGLKGCIELSEDISGVKEVIDTIEDIKHAFEDDDNDDAPKINVQLSKHIKVCYESLSFVWIPPSNVNTDDENAWNGMFSDLVNLIEKKFSLQDLRFKFLIQCLRDRKICTVTSGKNLMSVWGELKANNDVDANLNILNRCRHRCDTCDCCCELEFGHRFEEHDCIHGNMKKTQLNVSINEKTTPETCSEFCERMGRGHIHLKYCTHNSNDSGSSCSEVKRWRDRHETMKYKPNPDIPKDEIKHSEYWYSKRWKDPCLHKYQKIFEKCPYMCGHISHESDEKKDDPVKSEHKYCTENLWHSRRDTNTGHSLLCSHYAHVIFVYDRSGSMASTDGGQSRPQEKFIIDAGGLDNRLGALYEAIYKFNKCRNAQGCNDTCSAVMFDTYASIASKRVYPEKADMNIVNYLLPHKPSGGTSFIEAFKLTGKLVNKNEKTVVIFFTDGEAADNGSAALVGQWKEEMNEKLKLFCITLGSDTSPVIHDICKAGRGKELVAWSGNELRTTFTNIAKNIFLMHAHPSHIKIKTSGENDEKNNDQFACSNVHVVFICDCTVSMKTNDDGMSRPCEKFIVDSGELDNRLGALYEAIYRFNKYRNEKGCTDTCTAVMFGSKVSIAAKRVKTDINFVRNYLLQSKPCGNTGFIQAFVETEPLIDKKEKTMIIFLTDGECQDGGSAALVGKWKEEMGDKLSMFCITLSKEKSEVVRNICIAVGGKELYSLSGNEIDTAFTNTM